MGITFELIFPFRADEDPVDPKKELEERCKAPCTRPLQEYLVISVLDSFYAFL